MMSHGYGMGAGWTLIVLGIVLPALLLAVGLLVARFHLGPSPIRPPQRPFPGGPGAIRPPQRPSSGGSGTIRPPQPPFPGAIQPSGSPFPRGAGVIRPPEVDAERVLADRFARGEIDTEEYARRLRVLRAARR